MMKLLVKYFFRNRGYPDQSPNLLLVLRKYREQYNRLVVEGDFFYRLFYDDCAKIRYKQFCVLKHLWQEMVYRVHNAKTAGHFGASPKNLKNFANGFLFPISRST